MFSRLASWSDQHEAIAGAQNSEVLVLAYERPKLNIDLDSVSVQLTSQSQPDLNATLKSRVLRGMSAAHNTFEGVMIDNGAARYPSGLPHTYGIAYTRPLDQNYEQAPAPSVPWAMEL